MAGVDSAQDAQRAEQLDMSIGGVRKTLSRALEAGSPIS